MPAPLTFASDNDLIRNLRIHVPTLLDDFLRPEGDLHGLIYGSVASNTFRSFQGLKPSRPSVLFRQWATDKITGEVLGSIGKIDNQRIYSETIALLSTNLADHWVQECKCMLKYGHARKLVDLLMKAVARWSGLSEVSRSRLIRHLHVPLDSFSLSVIRNIAATGALVPPIAISCNATMGFIKDRETYDNLQELMRQIAAMAEVPPIGIDLLAWDSVHQK